MVARRIAEIMMFLVLCVGSATAQTLQPRWTPVSQMPQTQVAYVTQKPENAPAPGWPYYTDAPLFTTPTTGSTFVATQGSIPVNVFPQQQYVAQPQPVYQPPVALPPPMNPPQTPIYQQPIVAQPAIPPAQAAPLQTAPPVQPQPTSPPVVVAPPMQPQPQPQPQPVVQAPQAPAGPPVIATSTQPDAPFIDNRVFQQGGKDWDVFDITGYTSRFQAGATPENGVQEWILRKTGDAFLPGGDVARLVVTPQQVKVYHSPEVQAAVQDVLGRFLYYTPGQFRCRVQIIQTKDQDWRRDIVNRLQSISTPTGPNAWLISRNGASEFLGAVISEADGTILTNEEFVVANGQGALVRWASEQTRADSRNGSNYAARGPAENPEFDGVELRFSPLIDVDAATVEVDVNALVRRVVPPKENAFSGSRHETADVTNRENRNLYKIPPQKLLMLSLGQVTRFDTKKGLFQREKRGEILVFVDFTPEGNHSVGGVPIATAPEITPRPVVQTTSKPSGSRRPSSLPHVPPAMTGAVY